MPPESTFILQLAIGIVFLLSGAPKVRRPADFANAMTAYAILPPAWSAPVAIGVVICEIFIALAHLSGAWLRPAIAVSVALLLLIVVAVSLVLRRGTAVRCACFGSPTEVVSGRTLARVLLLLGAEVLLWFSAQAPVSLAEVPLEQLAGAAMAAVLSLTTLAWVLAAGDFVALVAGSGRIRRQ